MNYRLILLITFLLLGITSCTNTPATAPTATNHTPTTTPSLPSSTNTIQTTITSSQMKEGRAAHTSTLLANGTILLTGGFAGGESALASAELFDPHTHTFTSTDTMSVSRQSHTATRLPNGKVLIAGGFNGDYLASAEIYDPETGKFTPTSSMETARSGHIAILLNNNKVLLAGGTGVGWSFLDSAELYDPESNTFSATGNMTLPRESHTATLLNNGAVLIAGGHEGRRSAITIYDSAELYDPSSGTFSQTGSMTIRRHKHDATLLADGRVFISGGSDERDAQGAYRSTEIYDPSTGAFTSAGDMHSTRYKHTRTSLLLENGHVLLIGGASTPEVFDPYSGTFYQLTNSVKSTQLFATATLLMGHELLFAGGYSTSSSGTQQAWILDLVLK